jgi:chromosome segregation ATPase
VSELQDEIERLRYQLASARAEAGQLREERDDLRQGIERALEQIAKP